jgi:hypothetical protein
MKFEEILPALRAGKKARNSDNPGCVYYLDERGRIMFENEVGDWRSHSDTPLWKVANYDWTIVDPEPEGEVITRWAVQRDQDWYIGGLRWSRDKAKRALFAEMNTALHESGRHTASTVVPVRFRRRKVKP